MSDRRGTGWDVLLGVCVVILLLLFAYDYLQAPANEVKGVVTMAEGNAEATQIVKEFLAQHPVPNNTELRSLKKSINEQVALDVSRKATGNPSLQSPMEQSKADAEARAQYEKQERTRIMTKSFSEMNVSEKATFALYKLVDNAQWIVIPFLIMGLSIGYTRMRDGH